MSTIGKRSNFERRERDYYKTPIKAVEPLIPHLPKGKFNYYATCAGDGSLVNHLGQLSSGVCQYAADLEPQREGILRANALEFAFSGADFLIENPPWDRKFLHPFIDLWLPMQPMWLLFDANWMFTKQAEKYLTYCSKIVTIGRVTWVEGTKMTGKDDSVWYLFDINHSGPTEFYGRST